MLLTKSAIQFKENELMRLKKSLQEIRNEKRLSFLQADGDGWHDNFGYEQATREEKMILDRICVLNKEIMTATIIEENSSDKTVVGVGTIVNLKLKYSDDDVETFDGKIVAFPSESSNSEITVNSSIGRAILTKKVGDATQTILPNGAKVDIEILNIY